MPYRPDWWGEEDRGVCQIACDVMATHRGSLDRSPIDQRSDLRKIAWVVNNWQEPTDGFDKCVYQLIEQALNDCGYGFSPCVRCGNEIVTIPGGIALCEACHERTKKEVSGDIDNTRSD